MLSNQTQNRLALLIQAITEGEKKIEIIRQVLAEQKSFEPFTLFQRIDRNKNDYISFQELNNFLKDNRLDVVQMEAMHVFYKLDYNQDGLISYNDFLQTILPQEDIKLKNLSFQREAYQINSGKIIPYELEWGLSRQIIFQNIQSLLEQHIKNYKNQLNLLQILHSSFNFDAFDCFNQIDKHQIGYIDFKSINIFMKSCNILLSQDELQAFIRLLGSDETGRINFIQFKQAIDIETHKQVPRNQYFISPKSKNDYIDYLQQSIEKSRQNQQLISEKKSNKKKYPKKIIQKQFLDNSNLIKESINLQQQSKSLLEKAEDQLNKNNYQQMQYKDNTNSLLRQEIEAQIQQRNLSRDKLIKDIKREEIQQKLINDQNKSKQQSSAQQSQSKFSRQFETPPQKSNPQIIESNDKISPIRVNEEEYLVRALKDQITIEREVEEIKQQLSLKSDFNLLDMFKTFDRNQKGYCSIQEFQDQLNRIGINPSPDEMQLYFKRIDRDQDDLLRYSEFRQSILPHSGEYSQLMNNRPSNQYQCSVETLYLFKKLIRKQIYGEIQAEGTRQKLARRPMFSYNDAFGFIDMDQNGFITMDEFKRILNTYGFFVNNIDLYALSDRFDRNQDGKVSYGEFIEEMTPQSPQKYY